MLLSLLWGMGIREELRGIVERGEFGLTIFGSAQLVSHGGHLLVDPDNGLAVLGNGDSVDICQT